MALWCSHNNLETFRFLEFTVSQDLKCASHIIIESIIKKGPAEDACPAPAQEVQPASGASDPVLSCNNPVCAHPSTSGLDRPPHKTGRRLQRTTGLQQKIIGASLPSILGLICLHMSITPQCRSITHTGNNLLQLPSSGPQSSIHQTNRHKMSACCTYCK